MTSLQPNSQPTATSSSDPPIDGTLDADPDIDMNIAPEPLLGDSNIDFAKQDDFGMEGMQKNGVGANGEAVGIEERLPLKKDISLREFLSKMDDYAPIVSVSCLYTANSSIGSNDRLRGWATFENGAGHAAFLPAIIQFPASQVLRSYPYLIHPPPLTPHPNRSPTQ